jgi:hypothetical protein
MIRARCRTNLDGYNNIDWPELFCALPRRGDRVESLDGSKYLYVCGVVHKQETLINGDKVPYIEVEMTRGPIDY